MTNLSDGTAPVEAVDDALGVLVEALGEVVVVEAPGDVVLGEALGAEGAGVVAAGGEDVDGEAEFGDVDVCASALVNASVLTAAMAMTCFNMSASWGDLLESFSVAGSEPASYLATPTRRASSEFRA